MTEKLDPNHNEFFNSEQLMWENYEREMAKQGIELPTGGVPGSKFSNASPMSGVDETFFITDPSGRPSVSHGVNEDGDQEVSVGASRVSKGLDDIKSQAVLLFEKFSSHGEAANIENMIRTVERMQSSLGIRYSKFEPLRHISGLKVREPLENANRVVDNTMANYDMYIVDSIESRMAGTRPAVTVSIVGERGGKGFVARAIISAKRDFTGSEAIDYVHASPQGLFSVKRFERDRWVDASDDFGIRMKVTEVELESNEVRPHTAFIGEKIASGKDMIRKGLNLSDEDVVFDKGQVFSSDSVVIDKVLEFVKEKIGG